MSWFARAISNTLKLDDDEEDNQRHHLNENTDNDVSTNQQHEQQVEDDNSTLSPGRGVKEDLSEITETLTRKFWGVAAFLAPPPPQEHSNEQSEPSDREVDAPETISGVRRDLAEIGGRFRRGISKLSNNIDMSEITKMASTFLQLESKDEDYDSTKGSGAIGVKDEVVDFVRDIAMHPETWLDFPLPEDEDNDEDFDLSDAQYEHAERIEHLAPGLAALRIELCPGYMSESCFWKIYFVLLYPRLEHHAAEILSTPEIVKVRASLTQELKNHWNFQSKQEGSRSISYSTQEELLSMPSRAQSQPVPLEISAHNSTTSSISTDSETGKDLMPCNEIQIGDNSVIQGETQKKTEAKYQNVNPTITSNVVEAKDEDDADDWLKEESSETVTGRTTISIENDEDVSFSDLEEDDGDVPTNDKKVAYGSDSSTKDSRDWVQLGRSSAHSTKDSDSAPIVHTGSQQVSSKNPDTKEANDWLDVDDIDIA